VSKNLNFDSIQKTGISISEIKKTLPFGIDRN
jgi:hypothetical protein